MFIFPDIWFYNDRFTFRIKKITKKKLKFTLKHNKYIMIINYVSKAKFPLGKTFLKLNAEIK
jgi:hypothetical protein